MGYMGLNNYNESDNASDCVYSTLNIMANHLSKELKKKSNSFNTSGPVNVALFFEAFILPVKENAATNEDLSNLAQKTIVELDKLIVAAQDYNSWVDNDNRLKHLSAFKRMKRSLQRFLKNAE